MSIATLLHAQDKIALVVELTDGSENKFVLSDKPVITLPDNHVVITGNICATYLRSEIEKFYFVNDETSDVKPIGKDNIIFYYVDADTIQIAGLDNNTIVSVFSLDGMKLSSDISNGSDVVTIPLHKLSKGVYVVSFGNRSIKISR